MASLLFDFRRFQLTARSQDRISKMANHACLLVQGPDAIEIRQFEPRGIWKIDDANWSGIEQYMFHFDWSILCTGFIGQVLDIALTVLDSPVTELAIPCAKRGAAMWRNNKKDASLTSDNTFVTVKYCGCFWSGTEQPNMQPCCSVFFWALLGVCLSSSKLL